MQLLNSRFYQVHMNRPDVEYVKVKDTSGGAIDCFGQAISSLEMNRHHPFWEKPVCLMKRALFGIVLIPAGFGSGIYLLRKDKDLAISNLALATLLSIPVLAVAAVYFTATLLPLVGSIAIAGLIMSKIVEIKGRNCDNLPGRWRQQYGLVGQDLMPVPFKQGIDEISFQDIHDRTTWSIGAIRMQDTSNHFESAKREIIDRFNRTAAQKVTNADTPDQTFDKMAGSLYQRDFVTFHINHTIALQEFLRGQKPQENVFKA